MNHLSRFLSLQYFSLDMKTNLYRVRRQACWFKHTLLDFLTRTHAHTCSRLLAVCADLDRSSCLVVHWFYWCGWRSLFCLCVCVCGPCYTDEPLPLLDPGRVHAYFHSWWTISGLKWLWSGAGHFRGVPACFSALTAAVTVQAAPNFLTAARFLFAMGKVAVKSSMCLFWLPCD